MKALGRFSKRFYLKQVVICIQVYLLVVLGPLCGSPAMATPNNPSVVLGSTDPITTGNTTTVNLITEKAVINWQGLNTADGQQLIFDKSGASGAYFAVLNRVTSGGATQFNGTLEGHGGHVIIVNPNGIVFGSTAVINAFKFTASGLGINSTDYTSWYNGSGQLKFTSGSGTVTNNGAITAQQVNLIGKSVTNNGTIRTTSPDGLVVMAAGDKVYLAEPGSSVVVDTGSSVGDNVVRNTGTIDATGGGILLAAGDIFSQAAIEDAASFVAEADRDITLEAPIEATGDVAIWADKLGDTKGDVYANDEADITAGGNVTIKGNEVKLYGAVKAGADELGNVTPDPVNGKDLTITGRDCFGGDETEWRDVWAYSTLEASRDIIISDTGATETKTWVPSGRCGCGEWVYDTEYEPGTINLFGDVTAGRDLALYNITNTGPDVTLRAGQDIRLEYYEDNPLGTTPPSFCEYLTGDTWLALRAGNEIKAPETIISVTGSTLIMEQGPSINLDNFLFDLQDTTNLTLISNDGSVTAVDTGTKPENAADKWNTIGATAYENITLSGDGSIRSGDSGTDPAKSLWAKNGSIDIDAGQDFSADKDIEAGSDVTVMAGDNILLMGKATAGQDIILAAGIDAEAQYDLTAGRDITVTAGEDIRLMGNTVTCQDITLKAGIDAEAYGNLVAKRNISVTAGNNILLTKNAAAGQDITMTAGADVEVQGNLTAMSGSISATSGDDIRFMGDATADQDITLKAGVDAEAHGNLIAGRNISATAGRNILLTKNATAGQDIMLRAGADIETQGNLTAGNSITAVAGDNILITGNATAGQNITLAATYDVEAQGDLVAGQDIEISSSDDTTYIGGNVYAGHNITLNNNAKVNGYGDQTLEADNKLTANGYVRKCTEGDLYLRGNSQDESEISVDLRYNDDGPGTSTYRGNLWILGKEDIQISDDVTTFGEDCIDCEKRVFFSELPGETGGVAIISENGAIYTDGADGALDVSVTGSSDEMAGTGVYGFGLYTDGGEPTILSKTEGDEALAAIAIVSAEPLKITGELSAQGQYYDGVDNRASIGFLDDPDAEIPAGVPRNPGVAFDLAIYTASENGSVEIDCPVTIASSTIPLPTIVLSDVIEQQPAASGAMAVDAYNIVKLGEQFKESLAAGAVGDRLEVASRITEWLEDAVGRLPFPEDLDLPDNYNYVMRGAGLENEDITDGRAWVLENKIQPFGEAAPIQEPVGLKLTGCPALISWVAGELGVSAEQVQILFSSARGYTYDVQPCDTCARLQGAARILMDSDGSRIAALAKVVNEFASAGAPPSEEQMALIAAAMENPKEGSDYALASEWLDAMTQYVSILHNNLGLATEDAVATAGKYVSPVTTSDNTAVAGYVSAQLADIGG